MRLLLILPIVAASIGCGHPSRAAQGHRATPTASSEEAPLAIRKPQPTEPLVGRVLRGNTPVAGAVIRAGDVTVAVSDGAGRFRVERPLPAWLHPWAGVGAAQSLPIAASPTIELVLPLLEPATLELVVLDEESRPIPGALATVPLGWSTPGPGRRPQTDREGIIFGSGPIDLLQALSDEAGVARFDAFPVGVREVRVEAPGRRARSVPTDFLPGSLHRIALRLQRGASLPAPKTKPGEPTAEAEDGRTLHDVPDEAVIEARFVDPDGRPLSVVSRSVFPHDGLRPNRWTHHPTDDGQVRWTVQPDRWVVAGAFGYEPKKVGTNQPKPGERIDAGTIVLRPLSWVHGAAPADQALFFREAGPGGAGRVVAIDPLGRFELGPVPVDVHWLQVDGNGVYSAVTRVPLGREALAMEPLAMMPAGAIAIRIEQEEGLEPKWPLSLTMQSGMASSREILLETGEALVVGDLAPGDATLTLYGETADGESIHGSSGWDDVVVRAGETAEVTLRVGVVRGVY